MVLEVNSVDTTVNLEEIWQDGASFESEDLVVEGVLVELRCGSAFFAGKVTQIEPHEFGCRVEVDFSPLTRWNPELFRPQHMLEVSEVDASEVDVAELNKSESQAE